MYKKIVALGLKTEWVLNFLECFRKFYWNQHKNGNHNCTRTRSCKKQPPKGNPSHEWKEKTNSATSFISFTMQLGPVLKEIKYILYRVPKLSVHHSRWNRLLHWWYQIRLQGIRSHINKSWILIGINCSFIQSYHNYNPYIDVLLSFSGAGGRVENESKFTPPFLSILGPDPFPCLILEFQNMKSE